MKPSSSRRPDYIENQVPSTRFLELSRMSADDLEKVFLRGSTPELDALAGWEFRGLNRPAWARALGIKKFIKGFYREEGQVRGYNCPVRQNAASGPWRAKPSHDAPKRFGYYLVTLVDAASRVGAINQGQH